MDKAELHTITQTQQELTRQLTIYYRTTQTKILQYLDDNMCQMGEAELKMCLALYIEGDPLNASQFAIITALHPNTIRQHLFSEHVQAVNDIILDEMIEQ